MRLRHVLLTCASLPMLTLAMTPPADARETVRPGTASAALSDAAITMANVRKVIDQIDIPYQSFTLPNGLRVVVHTDHTAPVVNVSVWYDVGSKHEPEGRSGFAHLFEHLMFNGSENVPGDYLKVLMDVGAQVNGSTSADRTNYYETVPTQALDRALYMESDRMGHLLGAINQATLDEQRGVVENEKRQGDDSPTSIVGYKTREAIYPTGHPYGHSVIGSMKDLDAADLDDVRQWFKAHYGPNNALLILAGDIDVDNAKRLVTKYFGDIPAGPRNIRPAAAPVPMARTIRENVTAPVTSPIIIRTWPVPGADAEDGLVLDVAMGVMGGGDDDVFTRHLVREQKLFQHVNIRNDSNAQAGEFSITGVVRPGVDPKVAAVALDREIATFLNGNPSTDEVSRFVARYTYQFVRSIEDVTSRGSTLGESALFRGKPDGYKDSLRVYAGQTPFSVMTVARRWLDRPRFELTVLPGPRVTPKDDAGIDGSVTEQAPKVAVSPVTPLPAAAPAPASGPAAARSRGPLPAVGASAESRFPAVRRVKLHNGIEVIYAQSSASVPFTSVTLNIAGGSLIVPEAQAMNVDLMYRMLEKGFGEHNEASISRSKERLGLSLGAGVSHDGGSVALDAPDANLASGLRMMHQMVSAPTFPAATLERLKRERLDYLSRIRLDANTLARQVMSPLLDANSPFNRLMMYDDAAALRRVDRAGVEAAFRRWVRPEHATVELVSDRPLDELVPMLEQTIGVWTAPGKPDPMPTIDYQPKPGTPQIVLIDLPGAVQASVEGGQRIDALDRDPPEALDLANTVLGSGFTARINMNLREDKHWTYGAYAIAYRRPFSSVYLFDGTIQQDKVGPAIAEVMKEVKTIIGDRPITADEFAKSKAAALGEAASSGSNRYAIANGIANNRRFGRPDDYPARASERLRAVTLDEANAALRRQLSPANWVWCIVGNAAIIRPQLDALGLPVRVVKAADVLPPL